MSGAVPGSLIGACSDETHLELEQLPGSRLLGVDRLQQQDGCIPPGSLARVHGEKTSVRILWPESKS
jgi:hypothetical protein